jgi:hypothetical protein
MLAILCGAAYGVWGMFAIRFVRRQLGWRMYLPGRRLTTGELGLMLGTGTAGALTGASTGLLAHPGASAFTVIVAVALVAWGCLISFGSIGPAGLLHCYGAPEESDWRNCFRAWKRSLVCVMLCEVPLLVLVGIGRLF